ncbi:Re1-silencing transcription factor [Plakobranchus ocellatus]|uniref:Re1-silencing transcription factor n=1 Tax=Plakobranchus ocellatus TaxID=259542 RepID=A0AAV4AVF4_9GAST|nr:Re1-silencing transcription factor [Plakobranchus ocellatus]
MTGQQNKSGLSDKVRATGCHPPSFYQCGFYNCVFSSHLREDLLVHNANVHPKEEEFPCVYCGQWNRTVAALFKHMDTHVERNDMKAMFSCSLIIDSSQVCIAQHRNLEAVFDTLKNTERERISLYGRFRYHCNSCSSDFQSLNDLKSHIKKSLLKVVACKYCKGHFLDTASWQRHMKATHTVEARRPWIHEKLLCSERKLNFVTYETLASKRKTFRLKLYHQQSMTTSRETGEELPGETDVFTSDSVKTSENKEKNVDIEDKEKALFENASCTENTERSSKDTEGNDLIQEIGHSEKADPHQDIRDKDTALVELLSRTEISNATALGINQNTENNNIEYKSRDVVQEIRCTEKADPSMPDMGQAIEDANVENKEIESGCGENVHLLNTKLNQKKYKDTEPNVSECLRNDLSKKSQRKKRESLGPACNNQQATNNEQSKKDQNIASESEPELHKAGDVEEKFSCEEASCPSFEPSNKYKCNFCSYICRGDLSIMKEHVHSSHKHFKCRLCGIVYAIKRFMINHLKYHHGKQNKKARKIIDFLPDLEKSFTFHSGSNGERIGTEVEPLKDNYTHTNQNKRLQDTAFQSQHYDGTAHLKNIERSSRKRQYTNDLEDQSSTKLVPCEKAHVQHDSSSEKVYERAVFTNKIKKSEIKSVSSSASINPMPTELVQILLDKSEDHSKDFRGPVEAFASPECTHHVTTLAETATGAHIDVPVPKEIDKWPGSSNLTASITGNARCEDEGLVRSHHPRLQKKTSTLTLHPDTCASPYYDEGNPQVDVSSSDFDTDSNDDDDDFNVDFYSETNSDTSLSTSIDPADDEDDFSVDFYSETNSDTSLSTSIDPADDEDDFSVDFYSETDSNTSLSKSDSDPPLTQNHTNRAPRLRTSEENVFLTSLAGAESPSSLRYCCHLCPSVLHNEFFFRLHLGMHGGFSCTSVVSSTSGILLCTICGYIASSSNDHAQHMFEHPMERPFACSECDVDAHRKRDILTHIKNSHNGHPDVRLIDRKKERAKKSRPKIVELHPSLYVEDILSKQP